MESSRAVIESDHSFWCFCDFPPDCCRLGVGGSSRKGELHGALIVSAMFCQCHSSKLLNIDYNICNVVLSGSCSQKAFQTGDNKVTNPLK